MKPRDPKAPNFHAYTPEEYVAFAEAYLVNFNATDAAKAMRPTLTHEGAKVVGFKLLRRGRMLDIIKQKRIELSAKTRLSAEWVELRLMQEVEACEPGCPTRVQALNTLAKRVPGFFEPEQLDVSMLTAEEREAKKAEIIARVRARASEKAVESVH